MSFKKKKAKYNKLCLNIYAKEEREGFWNFKLAEILKNLTYYMRLGLFFWTLPLCVMIIKQDMYALKTFLRSTAFWCAVGIIALISKRW